MSLSNLTLKAMEDFGAIELKKNSVKNTYVGFAYSLGFHALLILLYCGWTAFHKNEDGKKRTPTHCPVIDLAGFGPPPSISKEAVSQPFSIRSNGILKPTLGIPVPIPDILAPNQVQPSNDIPVESNVIGEESSGTDVTYAATNPATKATDPKTEKEPLETDFIERITEEANPTEDIQRLMIYPETARRAGLEGKVTFSALIGKDGHVEKVSIDKSDYEVFQQPVIDAVMKVRFTPARQNQTPVRVWYTQTIRFKMH